MANALAPAAAGTDSRNRRRERRGTDFMAGMLSDMPTDQGEIPGGIAGDH